MARTGTGYGSPKTIDIPVGTTQEYVDFQSELAAGNAVADHESEADPHPQYTTDAEVSALLPRFVTYWKWS